MVVFITHLRGCDGKEGIWNTVALRAQPLNILPGALSLQAKYTYSIYITYSSVNNYKYTLHR